MLFQFALFGDGGIDPTTITPDKFLELMLKVAQYGLSLIGAIVLIYLIIAGIQYTTAAGDTGKQGEARKAIQAALIGFAITILAFSIVSFLLQRLNFDDRILNNNPIKPNPTETLFQ